MTNGLRVIQSTPGTTIQDAGRLGYRRFGVTRGGAKDPVAMTIANYLVGNPKSTACIEFNIGGADFLVTCESLRCALHGGDFTLSVNGYPAPVSTSLRLKKDDIISVNSARQRIRGYLAVEGGFDIPPTLNSVSTHVRSAIGGIDGGPLIAEQEIVCNRRETGVRRELSLPYSLFPRPRTRFRVISGPQAHRFTDDGINTLLNSIAAFRIDKDSDSTGYRLTGKRIEYTGDGNIVSDPVVPGCIQVPASGEPLVLMSDCPTTGGYPKIATVISTDLPDLAQLAAGALIGFQEVTLEEAQAIRQRQQQWLDAIPEQLVRIC